MTRKQFFLNLIGGIAGGLGLKTTVPASTIIAPLDASHITKFYQDRALATLKRKFAFQEVMKDSKLPKQVGRNIGFCRLTSRTEV